MASADTITFETSFTRTPTESAPASPLIVIPFPFKMTFATSIRMANAFMVVKNMPTLLVSML